MWAITPTKSWDESFSGTTMEVFSAGMDRGVAMTRPKPGKWVNLGAGNKQIFDTFPVDRPDWEAGLDPLPFSADEVTAIFAFHFFEHLTLEQIVKTLYECQRVLVKGGSLYTVTPWWRSECANQDLDHKTFWTESTWKNLLLNPYYSRPEIGMEYRFDITFCMIMGVVERNLAVVSQLTKF